MFSFFSPSKLLKKGISNFKGNTTYLFSSITALLGIDSLPTAFACKRIIMTDNRYHDEYLYHLNTEAIYNNHALENDLTQKILAQCGGTQDDSCIQSMSRTGNIGWDLFLQKLDPITSEHEGSSFYGLSTVYTIHREIHPYPDCLKQVIQANAPQGFGSNWADYPITVVLISAALLAGYYIKTYCFKKPTSEEEAQAGLLDGSRNSYYQSMNTP